MSTALYKLCEIPCNRVLDSNSTTERVLVLGTNKRANTTITGIAVLVFVGI